MTVRELIEQLQELPQDKEVLRSRGDAGPPHIVLSRVCYAVLWSPDSGRACFGVTAEQVVVIE